MGSHKLHSALLSAVLFTACFLPTTGNSSPNDSDAMKTISISAEIWCPYACEAGSERPGIMVEIMKEIFEEQGMSIEYRLMPWRRALKETERGSTDAVLGVVHGNSGRLLLDEIGLGVDETIVVLRNESDFQYAGPESLDSLRLGVIANYTYDNNGELDKYLAKRKRAQDRIVTIYRDEPLKSLVNMLQGYRIDAFLENRQVTMYEGDRLNFEDKIRIVSTGLGDTIHAGFTPNDRGRDNLDMYNRGLARLMSSGRVNEIVQRYGLDELPTDLSFSVKLSTDDQTSN